METYEEGKREPLGDMAEALERIAKLPYKDYEEQTDLAFGSVGLKINAFMGELHKMRTEFSHAQEYLRRGQEKDINETLEEYAEKFGNMETHAGKLLDMLAAIGPDSGEDEKQAQEAVGAFLKAMRDQMREMAASAPLAEPKGEKEREEQADRNRRQVEAYQSGREELLDACGGYTRLHVGDISPLGQPFSGAEEV